MKLLESEVRVKRRDGWSWHGRTDGGTPDSWYAALVEKMKTDPDILEVRLDVHRRVKCLKLSKKTTRKDLS